MTKIAVPDMMCENCVKRITNALTAAELKFSVSLDTKTVTIDGCDNCVKTAVSELEDLASRRRSAESLENRGGSPTGPASEQTGAGPVFCVGFMSPICYLFYFFSRLLHSSTALFFCKVGDITP